MPQCEFTQYLAEEADNHRCQRETLQGRDRCLLHLEQDRKTTATMMEEIRWAVDNPIDGTIDLVGIYIPASAPWTLIYDALEERTFPAPVDFRHSRFGTAVCFLGFRFADSAYFDESTFSHLVDFDGAEFHGEAWFSSCVFDGTFSADRTKFFKGGHFGLSKFNAAASFNNAVLMDAFDLVSARFQGAASFQGMRLSGTLWGNEVAFLDEAQFTDSKFRKSPRGPQYTSEHCIMLKEATFAGRADFTRSEFAIPAYLDSALFKSRAVFRDAMFSAPTRFHEALFQASAFFERTEFAPETDFTSVASEMPHRMQFTDVDMSGVRLAGSEVSEWSFQNVSWPRQVRLLGIRTAVVADESNPDTSCGALEVLYRRLRRNYEDNHGYGHAGDFHIGEMESRIRVLERRDSDLYLLRAYRFASLYGERWAWALILLVALLLTSAILVEAISNVWFDQDLAFMLVLNHVLRVATLQEAKALVPLNLWAVWGESALRILGPVQIAVLVLAVRRQVRR